MRLLAVLALVVCPVAHAQFDHTYAAWDALLRKHVRWLPDNKQSRVDYDGLRADRAALKPLLEACSAVKAAEFEGWTQPQQMAFLINAYNAYTLDLIFKWFREDFERGDRGIWRLEDLFARYAAQLADDPAEQAKVRAKAMSVSWLDCDWSLNEWGR